MLEDWMGTTIKPVMLIFVSGVITYTSIIIYTKLAGLRSFSKMSAADFAMTVAVGSLFASIIVNPSPDLINGLSALGFLFLAQYLIAKLRNKSKLFSKLIDNKPLLLMKDGAFIETHLDKANITKNDVYAKLREANAFDLSRVKAVIFETTGDISVLHGENSEQVSEEIMSNIIT